MDIVEGTITTKNWNDIVKSRFEKYNKGNHVNNLINKLNELISRSNYYKSLSLEYDDLSDDDKYESINKLKDMFTSDFKEEDIPINLKILFEEKRKEKQDLNLLNEYKENMDLYMSRYNLYENELNELFDEAQNDIYASKLKGISFEDYMTRQFNKKVDDNKAAARLRFTLYINKRSKLKEFTMLNDGQVSSLIEEVQLLISRNEVRDNQITEEFLIKHSVKYRI